MGELVKKRYFFADRRDAEAAADSVPAPVLAPSVPGSRCGGRVAPPATRGASVGVDEVTGGYLVSTRVRPTKLDGLTGERLPKAVVDGGEDV